MFELERKDRSIKVVAERHYKLTPLEELSPEDIDTYRRRLE
jgi:hypothetical protein